MPRVTPSATAVSGSSSFRRSPDVGLGSWPKPEEVIAQDASVAVPERHIDRDHGICEHERRSGAELLRGRYGRGSDREPVAHPLAYSYRVTVSYKGAVSDARQIGRSWAFGTFLDGSARRAGDLVRITAQLLEAETGAHLWAGKFDGDIKHVFSLQDRITASVIGAIEAELTQSEVERARRKRPDDLNAYEPLFAYAASRLREHSRGGARRRSNSSAGLMIDPAEAHGLAAWYHIQRIWDESAELSADLASALAHAKAVMAIRTDDASTPAFAAKAYARATRDYDTAIQMTEHGAGSKSQQCPCARWGRWSTPGPDATDQSIRLSERALRCSPSIRCGISGCCAGACQAVKGDADAAPDRGTARRSSESWAPAFAAAMSSFP